MTRTVALIGIAASLMLVSLPAAATARSRHPLKVSALVTELGTAQSGTTTLVGITKGAPLGPGTLRIDARPAADGSSYKVELFCELATIKGLGTYAVAQQADGSRTFTGTGRLTSGTGRFKRATSSRLKITGHQEPNDNIIQLEVTGTVSY